MQTILTAIEMVYFVIRARRSSAGDSGIDVMLCALAMAFRLGLDCVKPTPPCWKCALC